jgi:hypothetical protein
LTQLFVFYLIFGESIVDLTEFDRPQFELSRTCREAPLIHIFSDNRETILHTPSARVLGANHLSLTRDPNDRFRPGKTWKKYFDVDKGLDRWT